MIVFFVRTTEEMAHLVHNIESQEYSIYLSVYIVLLLRGYCPNSSSLLMLLLLLMAASIMP